MSGYHDVTMMDAHVSKGLHYINIYYMELVTLTIQCQWVDCDEIMTSQRQRTGCSGGGGGGGGGRLRAQFTDIVEL